MDTQQSLAEPRARAHAAATVTVQDHRANPFDEGAGPALIEICITESFAGDLDGESKARAFQVVHGDRSSSLLSLQRFRGQIGGRKGSFVLQGKGSVQNGKIAVNWFVVAGSGTEDLVGIRGEGAFEGDFGKGSQATLDYWFE
jgi:Protein of unknown function (DUF3224)